MDIYLNDQRLDATMEGETTLEEVVPSIEAWLGSSGLCITGLAVEGQDIPIGQEAAWHSRALEGIDRLDVTIQHVDEVRLENLITVAEYLELLDDALGNADEALLSDLQGGIAAMGESIRILPGAAEAEADMGRLTQLFSDATPAAVAALPAARRQEAREAVRRTRQSLLDALPIAAESSLSFSRICEDLRSSSEGVSQVALLLQTGQDQEAMGSIVRFSEVSQSMIRIFSRLDLGETRIGGKPPDEFFADLNVMLSDILKAFDARDSVLIGDLLEYEIVPRVHALLATVESMKPGPQ